MRIAVRILLILGLPVAACGPDPSRFSRDCSVDADCGLAALDPCSTCITHAFRIEDARLATDEAKQGAICPFGVKRCDGQILRAECRDQVCELIQQ